MTMSDVQEDVAFHSWAHSDAVPLTFHDLIEAHAALAAVPVIRHRKDQSTLTATERLQFVDAITKLNYQPNPQAPSIYGNIVAIHSDMNHDMHAMPMPPIDPTGSIGQQRFLPWHRVYLYVLEQRLRQIHPDVTIPYWDWTKPGEQHIPGWLIGLTPTVLIPPPGPGTVTVTRHPGTQAQLAGDVAGIGGVEAATTYTNFATGLEDIHNPVHRWVGGATGTMTFLDRSPADPIFWMHHANIDRLWSKWQQSQQGQGKNPTLAAPHDVMDPWLIKEPKTRNTINNFQYDYV
jgi:tyrosinase